MEKQWFVFYTKSRSEKRVLSLLEKNNHKVFLPLHKVVRQWSDRKKKVEVPLFNSYIFVKVLKSEIYDILQTPGIVKSLFYNGEPAVLREKEVENIKYWINTGLQLECVAGEFTPGELVKVIGGSFTGFEGEVYRVDNTTCAVVLKSLQQILKINIRKELLST